MVFSFLLCDDNQESVFELERYCFKWKHGGEIMVLVYKCWDTDDILGPWWKLLILEAARSGHHCPWYVMHVPSVKETVCCGVFVILRSRDLGYVFLLN